MRKRLGTLGWRHVLIVGLVVSAVAVGLALQSRGIQPHYSRTQVIAAALKGYEGRYFSRVQAKLMYRHDLERAATEWRNSDDDGLIWVVAVSGNYGISPSFGCCSAPADYPGHNTWGMAIIEDSAPTPEPKEFEANYHGDWPPFFDALPDLASGH